MMLQPDPNERPAISVVLKKCTEMRRGLAFSDDDEGLPTAEPRTHWDGDKKEKHKDKKKDGLEVSSC
mgnify:CR=1 FL=1